MLILSPEWTEQPQSICEINWSNPITRGLIDWGTPTDPNGVVGINSPTIVPKRNGMAHKGNGSSSYFSKSVTPLPITTEVTLLALVHGASGAADSRIYAIGSSASPTPFISLQANASVAANAGFFSRLVGGTAINSSVVAFEDAAPHLLIGTAWATGNELWVDGVSVGSNANTTSAGGATMDRIAVGALLRTSAGSYNASGVLLRAAWNRSLTTSEIITITQNPWQLFVPQNKIIPLSILSGAYNLNLETGIYSFTGSSATLSKDSKLTLDSGTYTISGSNAFLLKGLILEASSGSYSISGSDASVLYTHLLTASSGSYSITGSDATLTYTPTAGAYTLNLESGAYTLLGQDVTFVYSGSEVTLKAGSWIRYRIIT
jgi:hypothetical protein